MSAEHTTDHAAASTEADATPHPAAPAGAPAADAGLAAAATPDAVSDTPVAEAEQVRPALRAGLPVWLNPWFLLALLAFALAGWQWLETRARLAATQQELARRLAESDAADRESKALAKQSQEEVAALQRRFGALDNRFNEFQGQTSGLENLYHDLARSRDETSLAEIEQALAGASLQLQLNGNVTAAIIALEGAESRLASLDRPQFVPLRRLIERDLGRLREMPNIDTAGMSLRLENMLVGIDALPLAMDERPAPPAAAAPAPTDPAAQPGWLGSVWRDLWQELKGMVRIQRFDGADPSLLAPEQAFFLRENLKLRLLNARLALLARDQWTFRNELKVAQDWLGRYFDGRDRTVQAMLANLRQQAATDIVVELPQLTESLEAVRKLKQQQERR